MQKKTKKREEYGIRVVGTSYLNLCDLWQLFDNILKQVLEEEKKI